MKWQVYKMIRVLQCVNIMDRAGLETMLMNYYRNIDRTQIQFDFLTHREECGAYDMEIESLGGKLYHAPRLYPQNYSYYFKWMKEFFTEHPEYKIIHSHIDTMSFFPLCAAQNANVPIRIAHSHSSKLDMDFKLPIKYWAKKKIPKVATHRCACGELAGKFMYHNCDFRIIKNAIDVNKYSYDEKVRKAKRNALGLKNKITIGHVGRYCYIKNQLFLLDILRYILNNDSNYQMILVGKGEDKEKLEARINKLGIQDNVRLLIDRSDVNELYQVMDIYVMPSLFEGVPVSAIEAQTNGLPCIISNRISKEVMITNNIKMLHLKSGAKTWGDEILKSNKIRNSNAINQINTAGYNIGAESMKLQKWYCSLERNYENKLSMEGTLF